MTVLVVSPFLRRTLLASGAFTLFGSLTFGWPHLLPGQLAGLPATVPAVYRVLAVVFMLVFGGAYLWLARQPRVDRSLLGFAAVAKGVAFCAFAGAWLAGGVPAKTFLAVSGDAVFALLFARVLFAPANAPAAPAALHARSLP